VPSDVESVNEPPIVTGDAACADDLPMMNA
jgi:hypothetical protein